MKCSDNIIVRKSELNDIEHLKDIFARARSFMESTGNPDQWGDGHPQGRLPLLWRHPLLERHGTPCLSVCKVIADCPEHVRDDQNR